MQLLHLLMFNENSLGAGKMYHSLLQYKTLENQLMRDKNDIVLSSPFREYLNFKINYKRSL